MFDFSVSVSLSIVMQNFAHECLFNILQDFLLFRLCYPDLSGLFCSPPQTEPEEDVPAAPATGLGATGLLQPDADS